jgi:hypothetical protein
VSRRRGLEERLEVAVRPLPEGAFLADVAACVEGLAQIDDKSFPLVVG